MEKTIDDEGVIGGIHRWKVVMYKVNVTTGRNGSSGSYEVFVITQHVWTSMVSKRVTVTAPEEDIIEESCNA